MGDGGGGEEEERWGNWKGRAINLSNRLSEGVIIGERGFGIDLFSPFTKKSPMPWLRSIFQSSGDKGSNF